MQPEVEKSDGVAMGVVASADIADEASVGGPLETDEIGNDLRHIPLDAFLEIISHVLSKHKVPIRLDPLIPKVAVMRNASHPIVYKNVPRERAKFQNFVGNQIAQRRQLGGELWDFLVTKGADRIATYKANTPQQPKRPVPNSEAQEKTNKNDQAQTNHSDTTSSNVSSNVQKVHSSMVAKYRNVNFAALTKLPDLVRMYLLSENISNPFSCYCNNFRQGGPRKNVTINFKPSQTFDFSTFNNFADRLVMFEPYWELEWLAGMGVTSINSMSRDKATTSLTQINFDLNASPTVDGREMARKALQKIAYGSWGQARTELSNGETRLLLISLPKNPSPKKRADYHLWPKGTFVQLTGDMGSFAVSLKQRKMQTHDEKEWKGLSSVLDLTSYVKDPRRPLKVNIATHDPDTYIFGVGLFTFRSAEYLSKKILSPDYPYCISTLTRDEGMQKALGHARATMLSLVDDEEPGNNDSKHVEEEAGLMIISLFDSSTKQVLKRPVRGKDCRHFQCFDLDPYIGMNVNVSGQRWRCSVCEKFVSLRNLEFCKLTADFVEEFKDRLQPNRNRVEFRSNKTYVLLDEQKRTFSKRQQDKVAARKAKQAPSRKKTKEELSKSQKTQEVIEID